MQQQYYKNNIICVLGFILFFFFVIVKYKHYRNDWNVMLTKKNDIESDIDLYHVVSKRTNINKHINPVWLIVSRYAVSIKRWYH